MKFSKYKNKEINGAMVTLDPFTGGIVSIVGGKNFKAGIYGIIANPYQKLMRKGVNLKIADSHRFANHKDDTIEKFSHILSNSVPNKNISHAIRAKYNIKKRTIIPLCSKSVAPTLTTHPDDFIHYCEPRILTVREYARIQSFPDIYPFLLKKFYFSFFSRKDIVQSGQDRSDNNIFYIFSHLHPTFPIKPFVFISHYVA